MLSSRAVDAIKLDGRCSMRNAHSRGAIGQWTLWLGQLVSILAVGACASSSHASRRDSTNAGRFLRFLAAEDSVDGAARRSAPAARSQSASARDSRAATATEPAIVAPAPPSDLIGCWPIGTGACACAPPWRSDEWGFLRRLSRCLDTSQTWTSTSGKWRRSRSD